MIASLPHAVERTIATFDQLGAMWGPTIRPALSVHGLTHQQIHEIGGAAIGFECPEYVVATRITTPLGWEIAFFGAADLTCSDCCQSLARSLDRYIEAARLGGSDGSGL